MSSLPKYHPQLLAGLAQAYALPGESPLLTSRAATGLFPGTVPGKSAAKVAVETGWLQVVRTETRGKTTTPWVTLTPAGIQFLLEQCDPRPLLEQIERQLVNEHSALQALQIQVKAAFEKLEALRGRVEPLSKVVAERQIVQTRVAVPAWEDRLTEYLTQRQSARPAEDCPLPELYREARNVVPELSVGSFHDGLRRLHEERRIALQPWTGPLHELPEPALALLQGHSLAFYASSQG